MPEHGTIYLVTTGTRGDAAPFVAYGKRLLLDGYKVVFLSNADHEALARKHELPFQAISPPDWPQSGRDEAAFFEAVAMPGYRAVFDCIAAAPGNSRIVSRTGNWGAQFAAEKFGLPFTRIALQPCAIRRSGHPASKQQIACLDAFRRDVGLPELLQDNAVPELWENTVCFFPRWFGRPQSEWPQGGRCAGFIYLDDLDYRPDDALADFLRQAPPVVISLGSGMQNADPFFEAGKAIAGDLSLPVLFLSPWATNITGSHGNILVRQHVDHRFLFPRARLVIHNGGIGTVAQAIRARIPQIVIPLMWDQPDNAARVSQLGLGVTLPPTEDLARRLVAVVGELETFIGGSLTQMVTNQAT